MAAFREVIWSDVGILLPLKAAVLILRILGSSLLKQLLQYHIILALQSFFLINISFVLQLLHIPCLVFLYMGKFGK